jgi:hypothetical protein
MSDVIKAIVRRNTIRCGKCFHKIAECKGLRIRLGNGTIYLKCKHRDEGKTCNSVNEIDM